MLVVGSSLVVYSGDRLAAADGGKPIAVLNLASTRADDLTLKWRTLTAADHAWVVGHGGGSVIATRSGARSCACGWARRESVSCKPRMGMPAAERLVRSIKDECLTA